jgi:phospholipase C
MTPEELRSRIDTFVILMLENRSFDHMLGYLRLPAFGAREDVEGLSALDNLDYANPRGNARIAYPFIAPNDDPLTNDLPHERQEVAQQLAYAGAAGGYVMNGFVKSYELYTGTTGIPEPPPMRVLTPPLIPVTSFLADEYMVCDHWHAPLPTSTHPNRLMALSGTSLLDKTPGTLLPDHELVLDWLDRRDIRWRVYSAGLSLFMLMPKMWPWLLTDRFRSVSRLAYDVQHESQASFPQVIIVEPDYHDSPVHLSGHGNDNHPPLPVSFGEIFVKAIYEALTSNPARWAKTLLTLHYDEHGGFFDHVPPLRVPLPPPPGTDFKMGPFETTGPRVPALLISPYAPRRTVAHGFYDHTSVLQMLADRFDNSGAPYSESVEARRQAADPIGSVTEALSPVARADIPRLSDQPIAGSAPLVSVRAPQTDSQRSFAAAAGAFANARGQDALQKYPQIAHWLAAAPAGATNTPSGDQG